MSPLAGKYSDLRQFASLTHDVGMRLALTWVARLAIWGLLLSAACARAQAPEVSFEATRDGEFILVSASVELPVGTTLAWKVLTDYEQYPRFVTGMSQSRIVFRGPSGLVLEQKGEFGILFFTRAVESRMLVVEDPPRTVAARAINGSFKEMAGRYELQPVAAGVRLLYSGRIVPDFSLPPFIGMAALRYSMKRNFSELAREIVRHEARVRGIH